MTCRWTLAALLALASIGTGHDPARAASLSFEGTLSIRIATLDPVVVSGGGTANVNGSGSTGHLTALSIPSSPWAATAAILDVTDPGAFPIEGVQLTAHNAAGSFGGSGGAGFGGIMPLQGSAKVCLYANCGSTNNISNLAVPLSVVGQGGYVLVVGAVNVTVVGAPWTTGTAALGTLTAMGGVSPLSNTAAASGNLTLVTPFYVVTHIGALSFVPGFATLTLHFVPEPGTLALLATGIGGLVFFGRMRTGGLR